MKIMLWNINAMMILWNEAYEIAMKNNMKTMLEVVFVGSVIGIPQQIS